MPLPAKRRGSHLYLVSSNDHIVPGGTNTDLHVYNIRRAFPLAVDSTLSDDPFAALLDAMHGMGS